MMQPSGVVPPPMAPMQMDPQAQQQQQQAQYQQPQQWMMMMPHQQAQQQHLPQHHQQQQQQHQQSFQPQASHAWAQQQSQVGPGVVPPPQMQQHTPQAHTQQQYSSGPADSSPNEIRSLWIGDLLYWMDENYLSNCFYSHGLVSVKVIRNKQTGQPEGYGFIEFSTRAAAEAILQTYNGTSMPNSEQTFRLNWATLGAGERRNDETPDFTVFVGDLAADVTDYLLQETFKAVYSSVKGAKVVTDRNTGRSKGYGFVRFGDEGEQMQAMTEMNGRLCSTRPMRIGPAASKKPATTPQYQKASYDNSQVNQGESDPNNTTIFVGNLDASVTDEVLRQVFSQYGELVHVKIPVGKRCGFVQFANRACAEQALSSLNGTQLGGQNIRLSWGHTTNKQAQSDQTQWNGAYYGYPQGYEAYGYAPPPQDPSIYYGGYSGYANYQQPQQ